MRARLLFHRGVTRAAGTMLLALFALSTGTHAWAQQSAPDDPLDKARDVFREAIERIWIPNSRLVNGPHVRAAFREVVEQVNASTVEVYAEGRQVALGGIVGPDGWVLTKASDLNGNVTCKLHDGRELDAQIMGVDREYDLAMLKIDAKRLPTIELAGSSTVAVGAWVATAGVERDPTAVGVVSVGPRKIAPQPGILGVQLDEVTDAARVVRVFDESGAAEAGVLINDIVVSINGEPTPTREALQRLVRRHSAGDVVVLGIMRGDKQISLRATLSGYVKDFGMSRAQYQNNLGGTLSLRRFGFPLALQHDSVLRPEDCGGPLVNLEGEVIGFNISRSGRTESYALPIATVRERLYDLMSGKMAPDTEDEASDDEHESDNEDESDDE